MANDEDQWLVVIVPFVNNDQHLSTTNDGGRRRRKWPREQDRALRRRQRWRRHCVRYYANVAHLFYPSSTSLVEVFNLTNAHVNTLCMHNTQLSPPPITKSFSFDGRWRQCLETKAK
jgi:hypothetical protein